jgi:hypothetical protein
MRFFGLSLADRVPDYSTIWRLREALVATGASEKLFARFDRTVTERGYFALGGRLIDASIVEALIGLHPIPRPGSRQRRQAAAGGRGEAPDPFR